MTAPRRWRGRPASVWRTEIGLKFAVAVADTKYRQPSPITTPQAINFVLRQPEFAHLRKYKNGARYLQKQLLDAAEFWGVHPTTRELIGNSRQLYWLIGSRRRRLK